MPKKCMFCGAELTTATRAKEHIFPQWLQRHLRISDALIHPTHLTFADKEEPSLGHRVVSRRQHNLRNLLAGQVCATCNNGWMSTLESEVTPLMISLLTSDTKVHMLEEQERLLLARWAAKTAFVLNRGSNFHHLVSDELAHSLRTNTSALPPRVSVVGQHHHDLGRAFNWIQSQIWIASTEQHDKAEIYELQSATFKVSLQFGQLILLVSYWPQSDWLYVYEKGLHVPLYPIRGPVMWADGPEEFPWDDAAAALMHFTFRLGVAHQPSPNSTLQPSPTRAT